MRAIDLFSAACFVLAGLLAAGMIVLAPFALGTAIRAAHGTGTPGVWIQIVLAEVVAVGIPAALAWYGPIRYIRHRGWHVRRIQP